MSDFLSCYVNLFRKALFIIGLYDGGGEGSLWALYLVPPSDGAGAELSINLRGDSDGAGAENTLPDSDLSNLGV